MVFNAYKKSRLGEDFRIVVKQPDPSTLKRDVLYYSKNGPHNQFGETPFSRLQARIRPAIRISDAEFWQDGSEFQKKVYMFKNKEVLDACILPIGKVATNDDALTRLGECVSFTVLRIRSWGNNQFNVGAKMYRCFTNWEDWQKSLNRYAYRRYLYFNRLYTSSSNDITECYEEVVERMRLDEAGLDDEWITTRSDSMMSDSGNITVDPIPPSLLDTDSVLALLDQLDNSTDIVARRRVKGTALLQCVNNARTTDVISLENIIQFADGLRGIPELFGRLSRVNIPNNIKEVSKTIANAKLSFDYSVKTTLNDIKSLSSDLRNITSIARSRNSEKLWCDALGYSGYMRLEHAYKVYYGAVDESMVPLYEALRRIGAEPAFAKVWNVIPYSFVIDWFYSVESLLKELDYDKTVASLPIRGVTHGVWKTYSVERNGLKAEFSAYTRSLGNELPSFPYYLPEFSPDMNWWNLGALLVQRLR